MSPIPSQSNVPPPTLAELRRDIDRIDEAMHRLLLERGEIIDRLIKAKRTTESGSAFRPSREADMMRRLVERHGGILPLDTAESIWRVIIATFTYVQAPFRVHARIPPPANPPCAIASASISASPRCRSSAIAGAAGVVAAVAAAPRRSRACFAV